MIVISKKAARLQGLKRFFSGKPCIRGHIAERMVSTHACIVCLYARTKVYQRSHVEEHRIAASAHRARNRERYREVDRAWRASNKETVRASSKRERAKHADGYKLRLEKWVANNKKRYDELRIEWRRNHPEVGKRYRLAYPERQAARTSARRAAKLRATPPWLTKDEFLAMERIYAEAQRLSATTGVAHHVDHDLPLRGRKVCGLHVPSNLKIITAQENFVKNNRYDVDSPTAIMDSVAMAMT